MKQSRTKRAAIYAAIGVWFIGVLGAFGFVWHYKTEAGPNESAPMTWPDASTIALAAGKPNLVFFAHPQCPCTRASIAELARLATEIGGRAQIHVVLVRPPGTDPGFEDGTIAERAHAIAGARVIVDDGGKEADRFGALTSGVTLLYTADHALAFSGGLTTARGHEGRGRSHDRILAVVARDAGGFANAPTFGCELGEAQARAMP